MRDLALHLGANALGLFGILTTSLQQRQPRAKCHDGVAQLMTQNRQKLVLVAICGAEVGRISLKLVALKRDLLTLVVQLAEHSCFAADDVRLDRLLNKIDGARLIASKAALNIRSAGGEEYDWNMT